MQRHGQFTVINNKSHKKSKFLPFFRFLVQDLNLVFPKSSLKFSLFSFFLDPENSPEAFSKRQFMPALPVDVKLSSLICVIYKE